MPDQRTMSHEFILSNVVKAYNNRTVLDIQELTILQGEILAIVGPSGAGKSTLLRLLNFLEPATSGIIQHRTHRIAAGQYPNLELRRKITTVFQRPVLLDRSVEANVAYGLRLRGRRSMDGATQEALRMVGLEELASQAAKTLSGGEAQRVALARALVIQPKVLLLDEPTANLDPYNVAVIEETTRNINHNHGTTVILVTHNVFQAKRLAHRVALMLNGQIVELNNVRDFFDAPKNPRTKAFVNGEMIY